jgi:hypothetical protein
VTPAKAQRRQGKTDFFATGLILKLRAWAGGHFKEQLSDNSQPRALNE